MGTKKILALIVCLVGFFSANSNASQPSNITRILVVRHGETQWNAEQKVQGMVDIPLNECGQLQARAMAETIAAQEPVVNAIYSSDLKRAVSTAEAVAKIYRINQITQCAGLRERGYGAAEGITREEYKQRYAQAEKELDEQYPNRKERWDHTPVPGAETYNQVLERVSKCLKTIAEAHKGQTVVIASHGRVLKLLLEVTAAPTHDMPNCAIVEFQYDHNATNGEPLRFIRIQLPDNTFKTVNCCPNTCLQSCSHV